MDGGNNGKPYFLMDDLGENPLFSETSIYSSSASPPHLWSLIETGGEHFISKLHRRRIESGAVFPEQGQRRAPRHSNLFRRSILSVISNQWSGDARGSSSQASAVPFSSINLGWVIPYISCPFDIGNILRETDAFVDCNYCKKNW